MKHLTQILIAMSLTALPAATQAQELEAGMFAQVSGGSVIGPEMDSLLPPEVVPLDPAAAGQLSAGQAANRQATTHYSGTDVPAPGMVSAPGYHQDMRRQAFEQLYAQGAAMPQQGMINGGAQWRQGAPAEPAMMQQPALMYPMAQMHQGAPYQPALQGGPAQTQTLSGGVKNTPVAQDTRRRGFSNVLSAATTFGAGALTSAVLMRPSNPWLGAGFFGMTMTGLGNRNSFRF